MIQMILVIKCILIIFTCRHCPGVMKLCYTPCALLYCREWPFPTSRCRYVGESIDGRIHRRSVDVSLDGRIPRLSASAPKEYHIPRVLSIITSETLYFEGPLIKNILSKLSGFLESRHYIRLEDLEKSLSG